MPADDAQFWVGFQHVKRIGPIRLQRLMATFGSAEAAWRAPQTELQVVLDDATVENLVRVRKSFDGAAEVDRITRLGIEIVTLADTTYPLLLREVPSPPAVLYVKGNLVDADVKAVGIVGTR